MDAISFTLNEKQIQITDLPPTTTLLQYLRDHKSLTGTKEGCAEGDCGACTVVILDAPKTGQAAWRSVNACLILMPMLHGKHVYTIEGISTATHLHPVQEAIVGTLGSQCGYCTPGVVMTLLEACYRKDMDADWKMDDQLCGTLCRCTGYRPIRDAAEEIKGLCPPDALSERVSEPLQTPTNLSYEHGQHRFIRPSTLPELWAAIKTYPDHTFIAGATDLGLSVTKRYQTWPVLIGLDSVDVLKQMQYQNGTWSVGAAVRLSDLETQMDTRVVPLARMLRFFGSRQIKNRATVGGNLCNASPIGDLAPILFALDAKIIVASLSGERMIPIHAFFSGYRKTAMKAGEVLVRVEFQQPDASTRMAAYKVSKRRELDISAVSAGFSVHLDEANIVTDITLAYGGMAATTKRAAQAEAALLGQPWTEATVRNATPLIATEFTPMSDHRGSDWYRTRVAQNLLLGFYLETKNEPQPRLSDRASGTVDLQVQS